MLVCIDKITCVRMYNLIVAYWDEHIAELEAVLERGADGYAMPDDMYERRAQIAWMRETRAAVIVSEEQGEVEKFRAWELDIIPHRRLIKEGIDMPERLRLQPQYRSMQRMKLDDAFKEAERPLRIAIVCAMWLTGFDVPSLGMLYIDKPLKAHTLMQAIARANRVHEDKNNGLIVDYCGVFKHLRKALATFAGTSGAGEGAPTDPAQPDTALLAELDEAIGLVRTFLDNRGAALLDAVIGNSGFERNAAIVRCKEAANESDAARKRFEILCREVFRKFKACVNVAGINERRADRDAINIVYKSLQRDREQADISRIIRELHKVVDAAIDIDPAGVAEDSGLYDISAINFERLKSEFARTRARNTTVQNLRQAVESRLRLLLRQNPLRADFQRRYEEIVAAYNREKDRVTIERTFEALLLFVQELDEEGQRAVREGLDEESLAIFDLLKKDELSAADTRRVKAVAVGLLDTLKAEKLRVDQWRAKSATNAAVLITIKDYLWHEQKGLPHPLYLQSELESKTEEVYQHVYREYPTLPSPFYS